MKLAIINDTHAGVSNGADIFLDNAEEFFSEQFFPYLLEHKITKILHLGDYFDSRRSINVKALERSTHMFLDKLVEYDITMDIILGNHDVYYKSTNSVSATHHILGNHPNVNVIDTPTINEYDGLKIALVPWINPENYESSIEFIENAHKETDIMMGHFEIGGFSMMKNGMKASIDHGLSTELFNNYKMVLSGHFHTKSIQGNIHYLGSQLEFTWADCNDDKYFYIMDTASPYQLEQIQNKNILYVKLFYDDSDAKEVSDIFPTGLTIKDKFVKIIVNHKSNLKLYEKYIDFISLQSPFSYKIVDSFEMYNSENVADDDNISVKNTIEILDSYVGDIDTPLDKGIICSRIKTLYNEAQTLK